MTKAKIVKLLCRCIDHEHNATTPTGARYWARRYDHFRALCIKAGWPI